MSSVLMWPQGREASLQPAATLPGALFLNVCCLPTVVGNCWVHCEPSLSQVYFLSQHEKKMIRASVGRCLCFRPWPIVPDLKQQLGQMAGPGLQSGPQWKPKTLLEEHAQHPAVIHLQLRQPPPGN